MDSFPSEYYLILAFILVVPALIVGMILLNNLRKAKTGTQLIVKATADCPNCSHDLTKSINDRMEATKGDIARVVCSQCQCASTWNTTGFPPSLLSSDVGKADGISKNLKEKYGR